MGVEHIPPTDTDVAEELNRLLEIGRLLSSVLTPQEIENLRILIANGNLTEGQSIASSVDLEIGNTSVT